MLFIKIDQDFSLDYMHNVIGSRRIVKQKVPVLGTFCFFF